MRSIISPLACAVFRGFGVGSPKGPHITRYTMYRELEKHRPKEAASQSVLSISDSIDLCDLLGFTAEGIKNTTYPDVSILDLPFENESFDALVSDQVLEHIEGDPQVAMREAFRVVKPGGLVVQTTCLIMPMHMQPYDFWRFTQHGLRLLAEPHGDVLEASGWGTPMIMFFDMFGLRHEPIPERRWHPGNMIARANRQSWPVVTWVVARKHSGGVSSRLSTATG